MKNRLQGESVLNCEHFQTIVIMIHSLSWHWWFEKCSGEFPLSIAKLDTF